MEGFMQGGVMMRFCVLVLFVLAFLPFHTGASVKGYVSVTEFDPSRDASKDIKAAVAEAARTGRRVLLDVGGNWCVWCRRLDGMFSSNKDLAAARDRYYITVKINYSPENKNEDLFSRYPKIPGYPHLFVLETNGRLLHSQSTGDFESGKGYDSARIMEFLKKWAPRSKN